LLCHLSPVLVAWLSPPAMDFDDLDDAEVEAGTGASPGPIFQPELLTILEETGTPPQFQEFLDQEGLVSCEKLGGHIKDSDADEFRRECDKLSLGLRPPAATTHEQLSIRNAIRRCRALCEAAEPAPEEKAPVARAAAKDPKDDGDGALPAAATTSLPTTTPSGWQRAR